ncbi:MAG: paraquat-inducible protein A [Rhodospirillales bacterium]|nr:paraquat-inducible protein A [Rhodospirillales bacterium]
MKEKIGTALLGRGHRNSISKVGSPRDKALGHAILLCFLLWILGITVPLMTVEKVFIFSDTYALVDFAIALFKAEEWFIMALVVLFAGVIPCLKFDQMYRVWRRYDVQGGEAERTLKRIEVISKWSMGDVFVVAIGVVIGKTSGFLTNATVEPGFYIFTASVLGSMVISLLLKRSVQRLQTVEPDSVQPPDRENPKG